MKRLALAAISIALLIISACTQKTPDLPKEMVMETTEFSLAADGGNIDLKFIPLSSWTALCEEDWVNCSQQSGEASAEETVFSDCSFYDAAIEDSNLKGARFYNTYFTATQITRTNMTDAVMQGCAVSAFGIKESCIQGAGFDNISQSSLDTFECTEDEEWWQSHYHPDAGMNM